VPGPGGGRTSWKRALAQGAGEYLAFGVLLFVARFVARGHLAGRMDQECHVGGIAVDVLAHGVRFPLAAYSPNEYDNGSFLSGLLAAASFRLLGQSVLSLKLVTHAIVTAGAVASLWILRLCLDELGVRDRIARWTGLVALVVATASAPRGVTGLSMYAVGNHAEGAAIDVLLLALFVWRLGKPSGVLAALQWTLVGLALYANKGTVLALVVLATAEIVLARRTPRRLLPAGAGLLLGVLPEVLVVVRRHGLGWATIASKAERNAGEFPRSFLSSVAILAEHRVELLAAWILAVGVAVVCARRRRSAALGVVVGFLALHLVALCVMAQGGVDKYTLYAYPALVVLYGVLAALSVQRAEARWGERAAPVAAVAATALTALLCRPDAVTWSRATVSALWNDRAGAACSWRFAEGFGREYDHGLVAGGTTREEHVIERCRSLTDDQRVECVGGIARELQWRAGGRVHGEPPAQLDELERRAYAFEYGTHRRGDAGPCGDFASEELQASCVEAVRLECLVFADLEARFETAHGLAAPRCSLPEPPVGGYWGSMRRELLARAEGPMPTAARNASTGEAVAGCGAVFRQCYE
jgi:hypothetical protein